MFVILAIIGFVECNKTPVIAPESWISKRNHKLLYIYYERAEMEQNSMS